jgi:hypothetical protein
MDKFQAFGKNIRYALAEDTASWKGSVRERRGATKVAIN